MGRNCEQSCKSAPDYFHNLPDYLLSVFGSRILTKFSEKYRTKILLITCNFCFGLTGSVIFMSKLCSVQTPTNLRWHMAWKGRNSMQPSLYEPIMCSQSLSGMIDGMGGYQIIETKAFNQTIHSQAQLLGPLQLLTYSC